MSFLFTANIYFSFLFHEQLIFQRTILIVCIFNVHKIHTAH